MLKKYASKIQKFANQMIVFSKREMLANSTFGELQKIAFKESAEFIKDNLSKAILFADDFQYWKYVLGKIPAEGYIMEFGVFKGRSINYFSSLLTAANDDRTIYGFDSFEGFTEEWGGTMMDVDYFSQEGDMPQVEKNVKLIKGWVEDTYPEFVKNTIAETQKIAYLHIDVDTYTPTKYILENSLPYLQKGSIIDFDELLGYIGWKEGEFKAFIEILKDACEYEFIAFWENSDAQNPVVKGAIRILNIN